MKKEMIKRGLIFSICFMLLLNESIFAAGLQDAHTVSDNTLSDQKAESVSENDGVADDGIGSELLPADGQTEIDAGGQTTDEGDADQTDAEKTDADETEKPAAVSLLSVTAKDYQSIEVQFESIWGVEGYELFRGEGNDSNMQLYASLAADADSYLDSAENGGRVKTGTNYFYKIRAYVKGKDDSLVYGDFSQTLSAKCELDQPLILGIDLVSYKSQKLLYQKVEGATGYQIYRSTKKKSGYKKVATIKNADKLYYLDKKCVTGTTYYYKVRAYRAADGKKVYSAYSARKSGKAVPPAPTISAVQLVGADSAAVSFKKVKGASGYTVYRSTAKKGKYSAVCTLNAADEPKAVISGQENGCDYYYKVKAYYKKGKKLIYGKESKIKKLTFNFYTSAKESYNDKARRVFGTIYYNKYQTKEIAQQHMTTITVAVWDISPKGGKVTKMKAISVNSAIAPSVEKIFQEIYEGQEQFPIKDVGGFSWRGDNSRSEHCDGLAIDINANENYMIEGDGRITSGSFWNPGVSPYSIPADGEVVKIFKKYGFGWGGDGWPSGRHDYMHFSYFGT